MGYELKYLIPVGTVWFKTSLVVPWWRLLPLQRVWDPSLLGELRSYMPPGQKKKKQNIKQKQYCNKFNKDFKDGPHQKHLLKKWFCFEKLEKELISGEGGLGWGTHVNPWLIHVNVWQTPLQYSKVISLQLIKINEKKRTNFWICNKLNLWPFFLMELFCTYSLSSISL